jgi:hypothetical protein
MLKHIKPNGKKRLGGVEPEARHSASNMSLGAKAPQKKRFIASVASWRRPPPKKVAAPVIESDDSEDDEPLSKRQKEPPKKKPKKKKPYAVVGHQDGNGREWDEEFWTKEEYEAYKKRSDARIRASQAKLKLPNRGEPPDYVVGEQVFYDNACARVVVKRVWINKEAMDKDVQHVFHDASQIALEYNQAASSDGNRDKINVKHYNHNAWYEVIWNDLDKFRQIVPQSFLKTMRGPREPRPMVTEENSLGMPKPSRWHEFAADYDSDADADK